MDLKIFKEVINILDGEFDSWNAPIVRLQKATPKTPFHVLMATLLSLRSRDEKTAVIVKELFKVVNTPQEMIAIDTLSLEKIIFQAGFYKQKAKTMKHVSEVLLTEHGGKVPHTLEELLKIKGIGKKTANLVLASCYDVPAICVDIHVHRISNRLGFIKTKDPDTSEVVLSKKVTDKSLWNKINHLMVGFGQTLCTPLSPHCSKCPINQFCQQVDVFSSR